MSTDAQPKPLNAFVTFRGTLLGLPFVAEARWELDQRLAITGSLQAGATVALYKLAAALPLGDIRLPPGLSGLTLKNVTFTVAPDTGEFSFSGDADLTTGQTFSLVGLNFSLPSSAILHVELVRKPGPGGQLTTTLEATLTLPANGALVVSGGLAWLRDLGAQVFRELQNDEEERPQDLVRLELKPAQAAQMTLVRTVFGDPLSTEYLTDLRVAGTPGDLLLDLRFVLDVGAGFEFPFLKREAVATIASALGQRITLPTTYSLPLQLTIPAAVPNAEAASGGPLTFDLDAPIGVEIGDIQFTGSVPLRFNVARFALDINHEEGVRLLASQGTLEQSLLGLTWTFTGALAEANHWHYFTLVTKEFNYQLQLAPEASLKLAYTAISSEPIVFHVSEFLLSAKGLTLAADIADDPVRLNGLDTKFRFQGSRLHIVENVIQDLTIRGAGPLPPDLVGDAVADIALQFKQVEDGLRLVSGAAQLRGDKPLACRGTRFQFSIDAMGLRFVYDQRFHLYFTLSGKARFVPTPSDDKDGPLALLPKLELELVECPLTGDASVIAKHVNFLVEFPKPLSFSFLGAYGFELRAIGFQPQCEKFGGRGAMLLSGQILFAQGKGDQAEPKPDYHKLYIGLPRQGEILPQIDMDPLPVGIAVGEQFKLSGSVAFKFLATMQGFTGDGVLEITGLPPMAAAFGFLRVRRDADSPWVRAWFIYIEVRQVSFQIPVLQFYIREVGLGFGYRFTLLSIRQADEAGDIKQLIRELKDLSRTQGDLSKQDRWAVDLEGPGEDPRWTIVLRAMIAQLSAAPSPLTWNEAKERALANVFLFDAVIAVRSDLTFFMAVRGWVNISYGTFAKARGDNVDLAPLLSGFVLLSVRQKRFLAHLASNPDGHLGTTDYPLKPSLPEFLVRAIKNSQFSATLLIEPGLMHFELGWPNMLRWSDKIGPLTAEMRGGFIFRISTTELLIGISFLARARLEISASINLGLVGASLTAIADAAYSARFMVLVPFDGRELAMYGAVGLELRIQIRLTLWIKIPLIFTTIKLSFRFSFEIGFTAGLEIGMYGLNLPGVRGRGTISLSLMGHSLQFSVRLGINEGAVNNARRETEKYLTMGLEATDVETSLPGVDAGAAGGPEALPFSLPAMGAGVPAFSAPDYSVFTIREPAADGHCYFVLLPRGQMEDGNTERGFLPVPPAQGQDWSAEDYHDFRLTLPGGSEGIERFDPRRNGTQSPWVALAGTETTWTANWSAPIAQIEDEFAHPHEGNGDGSPAQIEQLTLRQYLRQAFLVQEGDATAGHTLDDVVPMGDPDPVYAGAEQVQDPRVQNPSDSAFEAAVRGAIEQFRGSPFFKHDPNLAYDKALEAAFQPATTIYSQDGQVPEDPAQERLVEATQQAHQIRGLVIHELVNDLRRHVNGQDQSEKPLDLTSSIPFQMGLVFRAPAGRMPAWLQDATAAQPTIEQRIQPGDSTPTSTPHAVQTFNLPRTDFAANPPRFQRLQHFTDANTIAIAWDLEWEGMGDSGNVADQPEHHLQYYMVRRRPLDGRTPEVVYRVKSACVLHREADGSLKSLMPRFQVVDHFNEETLEQQAGLPPAGRSYLYTITPVDWTDRLGQPLTLVVTRYPNEPPRVPIDGELLVEYRLPLAEASSPVSTPQAVEPFDLRVTWTEPSYPKEGPRVAIDDYILVFRREATLPIGSYGLDSSTQRARTGLLPTSNARALPTDVKVRLVPTGPRGKREATQAKLLSDGPEVEAQPLLGVLRRAGVFPQEPGKGWQPESWRIFFQAVSSNQVPSALAPVQLLLRARRQDPAAPAALEERHPAELEWLARPIRLSLLPPEDQRAVSGPAHFPMPTGDDFTFKAQTAAVAYRTHPQGLRCIRFRWNQGPSSQPDYPLHLTAGYDLLELDVDAHTTATFADPDRLNKALRRIQEVQMLPADDLWLVPGDTLNSNQWEAWYPSAILRRRTPAQPVEGAELEESPWYSWRESWLEWPAWPGLTDAPGEQNRVPRPDAIHPALGTIVHALAGDYTVELQKSPPFPPQDFDGFLQSTAPAADPYGWGVLQRLGLSVAFSLRQKSDGKLVVAQDLLDAVKAALDAPPGLDAETLKHLHVELLFQPGRRVELKEGPAGADALLGFVQLSLRPAIRQVLKYGRVEVKGTPGKQVHLLLTITQPFSLINQSDPAGGQEDLQPSPPVKRAITLPPNGLTNLLLRGAELPAVDLDPDKAKENGEAGVAIAIHDFAACDPFSTYFARSVEELAALFASTAEAAEQWVRFKRYAEALTPIGSDEPHIEVKADEAGLKEQLPGFMTWAQRFFDGSAPVQVSGGLAQTGSGAWLATAYPRVATPTLVAPDASGRLTYDHILQDKWAHDYRYYVRPYDRYRLLWQSLYKSPALFPEGAPQVEELEEARPDPEAGGLDVILDRTQPVDRPLVLHSARLDPPHKPGQPAAPGTTWEVIVAQHAEQSLVERNQTLVRQLAFRQVAFTLLRRFAFYDWVDLLEEVVVRHGAVEVHHIDLKQVENALPGSLPDGYPEQPEHVILDPGQPLPEDVALSLDLPARIGNFQQGALVLQWEALPFYYEHRLLLVAQTASTVSPVNEVTQRDFEYCSPDLFDADRFPAWRATVRGQVVGTWIPDHEPLQVRNRRLQLPLHRFWDCLPTLAQTRWPAEAPALEDGQRRKPSSLPDPEVVYQIVEIVDGNIEVQAEVYFDRALPLPQYAVRQLGRRVLASIASLVPPLQPQADYVLRLVLEQQNEVILHGGLAQVPEPTQDKLTLDSQKLTLTGVLTLQDRDNLLAALDDDRDRVKIEAVYDGWYCQEPIVQPAPLDSLPAEFQYLSELVDYPQETSIRYHGVMTPQESQALKALFALAEDQAAVGRLYDRSVSKGLYGSELAIMARRGGAAPSAMRPLEATQE